MFEGYESPFSKFYEFINHKLRDKVLIFSHYGN